jgi:hypothetical protein
MDNIFFYILGHKPDNYYEKNNFIYYQDIDEKYKISKVTNFCLNMCTNHTIENLETHLNVWRMIADTNFDYNLNIIIDSAILDLDTIKQYLPLILKLAIDEKTGIIQFHGVVYGKKNETEEYESGEFHLGTYCYLITGGVAKYFLSNLKPNYNLDILWNFYSKTNYLIKGNFCQISLNNKLLTWIFNFDLLKLPIFPIALTPGLILFLLLFSLSLLLKINSLIWIFLGFLLIEVLQIRI